MKKLIAYIILSVSFFTAYAQVPPNVVEGRYYRFISRSTEDTTKAIELTVVYDKQGNATITRQIMPSVHDAFYSYLLGIKGDLVTTSNDESFNVIYFKSSQKKFLVPFDDPSKSYTLQKDTLTLGCSCAENKSPCLSEYIFGFTGVFLDVALDEKNGCRPVVDFYRGTPVKLEGGFLVVKANSISFK